MKTNISRLFIVGLAISAFVVTGCQQAPNSNSAYGRSFNSAKISYTIKGTSEGTAEYFFKDDKIYTRTKFTKIDANGENKSEENISIKNRDQVYELNANTKTGMQFSDPEYSILMKLPSDQAKQEKILKNIVSVSVSGEETSEIPKPIGKEIVAGQECDVYEVSFNTFCLWQGLVLKQTTKIENTADIERVATKIEINPQIDDSVFDVPSDFKIQKVELK